MKTVIKLFVLTLAAGATAPLLAHHSFAEFNANEMITVEGVVTEFRLVNPHAMLSFDVTEEDGTVRQWRVEFDGRLNLGRAGWTPDTIKVGETVSIEGNPAVSGSPYMFFQHGWKGDGTELIRPFTAQFDNVEEIRRQRRAAQEANSP